MRVVALLQARMGSTRLPGKVLREINGLPLIVHIWRRLLACREVDDCRIALGCDKCTKVCMDCKCEDCGPFIEECVKRIIRVQTGPEENLLSRLLFAGAAVGADAILRVRADCLFLDPHILDNMIREFRRRWPHRRALANWPNRLFSEGIDAEVWTMDLLSELDRTQECPREDFATWAIARCLVAQYTPREPVNDGEAVHLSIDTEEHLHRAERMLKRIGNDDWNYQSTLRAWEMTK